MPMQVRHLRPATNFSCAQKEVFQHGGHHRQDRVRVGRVRPECLGGGPVRIPQEVQRGDQVFTRHPPANRPALLTRRCWTCLRGNLPRSSSSTATNLPGFISKAIYCQVTAHLFGSIKPLVEPGPDALPSEG